MSFGWILNPLSHDLIFGKRLTPQDIYWVHEPGIWNTPTRGHLTDVLLDISPF